MELIDRLKTIKVLDEAKIRTTSEEYDRILDVIGSMPPAQPEIVRCEDCKHREAETGFCKGRGWPMQLVSDDGFCDKGERKS